MGVLNHIRQALPQLVVAPLGWAWSARATLHPAVEPVVGQAAGFLQLPGAEQAVDLQMDGGIGP